MATVRLVRPRGRYFLVDGHCRRQCIEVRSTDPIGVKHGKKFHLHFFSYLDWLCSTFVLCVALPLLTFQSSMTASLSTCMERICEYLKWYG